MPQIKPIPAVTFAHQLGADLSALIAPPYDVLDENDKARLLERNPNNIVGIDLPHLPAKTVGPDSTYQRAGERYRQALTDGVLQRQDQPTLFAYQQSYTVAGRSYQRRGLIANVALQPFGPGPAGQGGIYPHEQTFSGPKEDRLKLMRATQAQLSPIFGLHSDPQGQRTQLLARIIESRPADFFGVTTNDGVRHEVWEVRDSTQIQQLAQAYAGADIFIADGHHRYTTALNFQKELRDSGRPLPNADVCLFVLVAMQDAGMIVLPTHRVLGGMQNFSVRRLAELAEPRLGIRPFAGRDLNALEKALPTAGPHAIGLYDPNDAAQPLWLATTPDDDPLAAQFPKASKPWRQLDVAIVQHLLVEELCQPRFAPADQTVQWKFPHTLDQLQKDAANPNFQLGVIVQPTPLESVRLVSEAGELMPQKSTFFYPKLATGLVINPLD